jgi:hypothetical protein
VVSIHPVERNGPSTTRPTLANHNKFNNKTILTTKGSLAHHVTAHMQLACPKLPNPQTPKFAQEFLRSTVHDVEILPQLTTYPTTQQGKMKFLKVGRVAIITRGRYAGKKVRFKKYNAPFRVAAVAYKPIEFRWCGQSKKTPGKRRTLGEKANALGTFDTPKSTLHCRFMRIIVLLGK